MKYDDIVKWINKLEKYPGTLEEFNKLKGKEHTIVDTERSIKFIYISSLDGYEETSEFYERMMTGGVSGLIHYRKEFNVVDDGRNYMATVNYGVPVKPK